VSKEYKDLIFDIDTGELRQQDKPHKPRRGWGTTPKPKTKKVKYPPIHTLPKEDRMRLERMSAPRWGMPITRAWVKTQCLEEGNICKRFHSVSLSDGEIQYVICVWGPKKVCEAHRGGRPQI